jgi:hypothetical protein
MMGAGLILEPRTAFRFRKNQLPNFPTLFVGILVLPLGGSHFASNFVFSAGNASTFPDVQIEMIIASLPNLPEL